MVLINVIVPDWNVINNYRENVCWKENLGKFTVESKESMFETKFSSRAVFVNSGRVKKSKRRNYLD